MNGRGGSGAGTSSRNTSTRNINANTSSRSGSSSYRSLAGSFVSGNSPHKTMTSHLGHEMVMSPMAATAAAVVHSNNSSYYANTQQMSPNRFRAKSIMDLSRRTQNLDSYSNDDMEYNSGGEGDVEMGMVAVVQALDGGIGDGDDEPVRTRRPASLGGLDDVVDTEI